MDINKTLRDFDQAFNENPILYSDPMAACIFYMDAKRHAEYMKNLEKISTAVRQTLAMDELLNAQKEKPWNHLLREPWNNKLTKPWNRQKKTTISRRNTN